MRAHLRKTASAILTAMVVVSIASPSLVWAEEGGRDDRARAQAQAQAQARQAQQRAQQQAKEREQKEQRERAEQAKREREKQQQAQAAREKAAREQAAKQAAEKAARERAQQAERARQDREKDERESRQEREKQERERNDARVLGATDTRDSKPSDHPSGKDRNDERGASFPQGASRSNPDGGGVDKPFAVGSLAAGSQGRGDFDGNNGCGNDNDFADDNNGKCLGRQVSAAQNDQKHEPKTEVAGVQTQAEEKPTRVADDDKVKNNDKRDDDKKDERREAVKSAENERKIRHHWWLRFWEWCQEVLGKTHEKPEVAGVQVQAPTPTHTATSVPKPTQTPQVSGAKAINDHECVPTEWHWVLNQLDREQDAPRAISVTWANGQTFDIPLEKYTGKVAHYTTTANLNVAVTNATAVAPAGWSGQFNLSHGPCFGVLGTQATAEPSKTPEPTATTAPTNTAQPTATHTPQPTATNTPIPTATVPPTPTLGSGVLGKVSEGHECVTYEWHWVITQLDSEAQAPSFIRVTWANGQTLDVARTGFTGHTAHYTIGINLNSRVTSAVAGTALPSGWSGQFNLSHGPCI